MHDVALDPDIARTLERARAGGWLPLTGGSVARARESYRDLSLVRRGEGYVPLAMAAVSETTLPGPAGALGARVYLPHEAGDVLIVFLHGGGWVIGDLDTHDPICRALAAGTRARVVSIDYRLAPEAPFPAALDDAMAALRWAADAHPQLRIAVAGDSAGGGLAAGLALRARDEPGAPPLVAQLLVYPALDPFARRPSVQRNGEGYFLTRADMEWFWGHYLAAPEDRSDPRLDVLAREDLAGLAPAVLATAEFDPLCDEGRDYGRRLAAAGVDVREVPGEGLCHGWFGLTEVSELAAQTRERTIAAFAGLLAGEDARP